MHKFEYGRSVQHTCTCHSIINQILRQPLQNLAKRFTSQRKQRKSTRRFHRKFGWGEERINVRVVRSRLAYEPTRMHRISRNSFSSSVQQSTLSGCKTNVNATVAPFRTAKVKTQVQTLYSYFQLFSSPVVVFQFSNCRSNYSRRSRRTKSNSNTPVNQPRAYLFLAFLQISNCFPSAGAKYNPALAHTARTVNSQKAYFCQFLILRFLSIFKCNSVSQRTSVATPAHVCTLALVRMVARRKLQVVLQLQWPSQIARTLATGHNDTEATSTVSVTWTDVTRHYSRSKANNMNMCNT